MLILGRTTRLAAAAAGRTLGLLLSAAPALADAGFERWVAGFRDTAVKSGVSGAVYDRAFRNVTAIDPEVLEKARTQPEFTAPVWDDFDNRVHENSVAVGRLMAAKYRDTLGRIEARFGVDRHILLAIWLSPLKEQTVISH
jgi:membrane-bound lytic murein transglycosylase B